MKKLLILLLLVFTYNQFPQQDKFIIGVDWINPTWPNPGSNYQLLNDNYWDSLQSFGVNFGALNIGRRQNNGYNEIITELSQAANRDITIFLWTYLQNSFLQVPRGRRWMYQVEGTLDFNTHQPAVGQDARDGNNLTGAEPHWSLVNVEEDPIDYWNLNTLDHIPGIAAEDLINDDEIPDGTNYYVRLRLRKTDILNDTIPVVKVIIINKNTGGTVEEKTILANELNQNEWIEKDLFVFYKSANPPYDYVEGADNILITDSLGITGVDDYTVTVSTYTPYEIKIEWFDDVSCDLDYITVEDKNSFDLHNGYFDDVFQDVVSKFGNHPGLGKIKVWDEPARENLLPVRKMKSILDGFLTGTGNEDKTALAFHSPLIGEDRRSPVQQYLAQSSLINLLADIYPIPYYADPQTQELFVVPTSPDYNEKLQERFNSHLIAIAMEPGLYSEIQRANLFEVPFWYTPQAHEWNVPGRRWHREPSAYEIKAMANLGVCYGAKGIHYFMYSEPIENGQDMGETLLQDDDINDPVPRYTDYYGYPKWETVKQLNNKLASMGNELISLTWQSAIYIPDGQPTGSYLTNVQSYYCPIEGPCIPDPPAETYIQLGIFKWTDEPNNDNLEHFFVVNRRTLNNWAEQRDIKVQYDKSSSNPDNWQNWIIKEVGTENYWIDGESGEFITHYDAGDGILFRLEPVVMGGGNLIVSETISRDIELHGELTIESGATLHVNADYHCYGNIILNGGVIQGNGKIFFYNNKRISAYGTSQILGSFGTIELDFIAPHTMNGIYVMQDATFRAFNCIIRNSRFGISVAPNTDYFRASLVQFYNCTDYGISISGPSSTTPVISLCQFNNSSCGLGAYNLSEILVQLNQFINNDIGVNLVNVSVPHILENTISSNENILQGIFLESCNGEIRENTITGHTSGIHLGNSSPNIAGNNISDNLYHGIYIGAGSLPNMDGTLAGDPPEYYPISGYNTILENGGTTTGGPIDNDGSEIYFYSSNALMSEGCNSIYDDRPGGERPPYYTKLLMNGSDAFEIEIYAEGNYWSEHPQYPLEERFGNLIVYYEPFLSDPCDYPSRGNGGEELFVKTSSGEIIDTLFSAQKTISNLNSTDLLYAVAEEYFITADYEETEGVYNQIVNSNVSLDVKLLAYQRLYEIGKLSSKPEAYFSDLYNIYSSLSQSTSDSLMIKIFKQLSSLSLVGEEEYIPAIGEFDEVIQQNPNTEEAIYAEIDAITIALLVEGDSTLQKGTLSKYLVKNSEEYLNKLNGILSKHFGSERKKLPQVLIPKEFTLYQNYPNPFNPVTTIKYDLPNVSDVSLMIYDILGRRVETLVNEQKQQPGRYEVQFDASSLASGIYLYQIRVEDFVSTKKMILLK